MTVKSLENITLNKGEWAEFYVMLKLLGEGKLYIANALLQKNIDHYLDILKVIREEADIGVIHYIVDESTGKIQVVNSETNELLTEVEKSSFDQYANELFNDISRRRGAAFSAPKSVCDFARVIYVSNPKAPAVQSLSKLFGGKNDIFIEVRDPGTTIVSVMGFSIKSKFGQPPTLFNAGTSSQLLFQVKPCDDNIMATFNGMVEKNKRQWGKCKQFLVDNNIDLVYMRPQNSIYKDNLDLIAETMSDILAWCYKDAIVGIDRDNQVKETIERLIEANPLSVAKPEIYYKKKIKDFLIYAFNSISASVAWDGEEKVSGGYIVVMENGEVLCYHSVDREGFREYLFNNTHFEYVSAKKYKWSYIQKDESTNEYYLPVNASVRFNKGTRGS